MILTATEVTVFSDITATVQTIINQKLIEEVQGRITLRTNNYFTTDLYVQDYMLFNPSALTITCSAESFSDNNFASGDDIFIYQSYRNDGYFTLSTVASNVLTLASGSVIKDELSGKSILISVVNWPMEVKKIAARMIAYDYDYRNSTSRGIKSRTLGPLSESYFGVEEVDSDGYPSSITEGLSKYTIARLM